MFLRRPRYALSEQPKFQAAAVPKLFARELHAPLVGLVVPSFIIKQTVFLSPSSALLSLFFVFYGNFHHIRESARWNWSLVDVLVWF